jgi:hypothetical protein
VGKSRDLRRRIGSYFRPLAADHRRRAGLLAEIRDLIWETVPSELEALLMETEAIRSTLPAYNQQIAIHADGSTGVPHDADLAFVLCDGDPESVSLFLLRGPTPWARGRLPREPLVAAAADALSCIRAWARGQVAVAEGLLAPLDAEGETLVSRYLRLHRDRIDRLRLSDFPDEREAAEALAALVVRPRPAWEPWSLRARSC